MGTLFSFFGAALLLGAAHLLARFLVREKKRSLDELAGLILFLERLREGIGCYLAPSEELFSDFTVPALEANGFLPFLRERCDLADTFRRTRGAFALPERAKEILSDFSEGFGGGYREEELARAERARVALSALYEGERVAFAREARLRRVLCFSGALSLVLLLL